MYPLRLASPVSLLLQCGGVICVLWTVGGVLEAVLGLTVESLLLVIPNEGSRHGGADNTQVYLPGRRNGILEGAGTETPTKVTL